MAGPNIPQWKDVQGIQQGAMGQAYDRAGALFGSVIQGAQNILDSKVERESALELESIMSAETSEDVNLARETGKANVWADQSKLGAAGIQKNEAIKAFDMAAEEKAYSREQDALTTGRADEGLEIQRERLKNDKEYNDDMMRLNWAKFYDERRALATEASARLKEEQANNALAEKAAEATTSAIIAASPKTMLTRESEDSFIKMALGESSVGGVPSEEALLANLKNTIETGSMESLNGLVTAHRDHYKVDPNPYEIAAYTKAIKEIYEPMFQSAARKASFLSAEGINQISAKENAVIAQIPRKEVDGTRQVLFMAQTMVPPYEYARMLDTVQPPADAGKDGSLKDSMVPSLGGVYNTTATALVNELNTTDKESAQELQKTNKRIMAKGFSTTRDVELALVELRNEYANLQLEARLKDYARNVQGSKPEIASKMFQARKRSIEEISRELGVNPEELDFNVLDNDAGLKKGMGAASVPANAFMQ